jgi:hypothetical protein
VALKLNGQFMLKMNYTVRGIILCIARRAFISIDRQINRAALMPVGHSLPAYESPTGKRGKRNVHFSIDMIPLRGITSLPALHKTMPREV